MAAILFAAGCRALTPGAGAEGTGDQCPDQQAAAEPVAQPASGGAQAIADAATSIVTDANEIARLSRSQRLTARSIALVARQIAADANRLLSADAEGAEDQEASASADQASADQAGTDQAAGTDEAAGTASLDTSVEATATRMAAGGRFIESRAGRIAERSNNTRVDELANGIVTKAQTIVTEAEALGQGTEPAETTTTAPAEECDETTTTGAGGEETTTTTGDGEETTTTQGDGEETTTTAPTTTLPPIDTQNCDPAGLKTHTGIQTRDGQDVCHTAIFGVIPGAGKIPAVRILQPENNATLPVGQTFTATIKFRNWQGGVFDDPAALYGVRPFSLAPDPNDPSRQIPIGHAHIYVQRLVDDDVPAETLDSFLALNQASEDGETLSGTVPAVAQPGLYRICTDLSGGNHLTFPKGVAQATQQGDCVRVTFQ